MLASAGVTAARDWTEMIRPADRAGRRNGCRRKRSGFTPRARKILDDAVAEAQRFHEEQAGTEHILIAILEDGECVGYRLLNTMNVRLRELYTALVIFHGREGF